jgi:hypothetical protein
MKGYIEDIIPMLQRFSKNLDNITLLTKQHWTIVEDICVSKTNYIFQKNGVLINSIDGKVNKAKWEYLGFNSILIEKESESLFLKLGFFDENILILKIDNSTQSLVLINESIYESGIKNFASLTNFINNKYLKPSIPSSQGIENKQKETKPNTIENNTFQKKLSDGTLINIEIISFNFIKKGAKVYDKEMNTLKEGRFKLDDGLIIIVEETKIKEIFYEMVYKINNVGELKIEQIDGTGPSLGDFVQLNDENINSGIFKINYAEKIFVENSRITKRTIWGF